MTPTVALILWKRRQEEWTVVKKASWTICLPMRAKFRGQKGFEVEILATRSHSRASVIQLRENVIFLLSLLLIPYLLCSKMFFNSSLK